MLRFIARIWAKQSYIFRLESEAQTNLINSGLAAKRAAEKRAYIAQLENEAAAIEANIAREIETEEYKNLTGQEKYEADREKREAEKVIEDKRIRTPTLWMRSFQTCSTRTIPSNLETSHNHFSRL